MDDQIYLDDRDAYDGSHIRLKRSITPYSITVPLFIIVIAVVIIAWIYHCCCGSRGNSRREPREDNNVNSQPQPHKNHYPNQNIELNDVERADEFKDIDDDTDHRRNRHQKDDKTNHHNSHHHHHNNSYIFSSRYKSRDRQSSSSRYNRNRNPLTSMFRIWDRRAVGSHYSSRNNHHGNHHGGSSHNYNSHPAGSNNYAGGDVDIVGSVDIGGGGGD